MQAIGDTSNDRGDRRAEKPNRGQQGNPESGKNQKLPTLPHGRDKQRRWN